VKDEDHVDAVVQALAAARAAAKEVLAALDHPDRSESGSDVVSIVLDADGYVADMFIDPIARAQFTNTELEELITAEMRAATVRLRESAERSVQRYYEFGAGATMREMLARLDNI